MSDQFTDLTIVEANRLHSEEAKGGNNENYSLWTNNLQDILFLEPQDKVSVYGAFISERGAGQSTSIEIKGVELDQEKEFQYTKIDKKFSSGYVDANGGYLYEEESLEFIRETHQLRDDTLRFIINYFIPANAMNSMALPRRWIYNESARANWTDIDNRNSQGASLTYPEVNNNTATHLGLYQNVAFYNTLPDSVQKRKIKKPVFDNSRYTIMIRNDTYFSESKADGNLPDDDLRDPENHTYQIYREMKNIQVPHGFNSAEYLATEITRKLQNIIEEKTITQKNFSDDPYPIEVLKIINSETYKAFNVGIIQDLKRANFLNYFNLEGSGETSANKNYRAGHTNASGYEYLRDYQVIATKYPELYEKGRLINRFVNEHYAGILGAEVHTTYLDGHTTAGKPSGFELSIPYNKNRCDEFKAFFDAQLLYPEIITNLNDPDSGYNAGNSVDNTRWIHINRFENASQYLGKTPNTPQSANTQLGWGGYYYPRSWAPAYNQIQLCSFLLCLFFRPEDKDVYYTDPDTEGRDQYTYGCLGKSSFGNIIVYPSRHAHNGHGTPAFKEILRPVGALGQGVESNRKIGFDLHFNAPGMYYLMPLSGHEIHTNPLSSYASSIGNYLIPSDDQNGTMTNPAYDVNLAKRKLYIGADKPSLNWDGTNFSFQGFHTGLNRGNQREAGVGTYIVSPEAEEEGFEDVVYKINPVEQFLDWTPDRTPYVADFTTSAPNGTFGTGEYKIHRLNQNLEKWRIYDQLCGIMVEDFGIPEELWSQSLFGLLGFSYRQFHSKTNNRQTRISQGNANDLSVLTTNAEIIEGDTKLLSTNWAGTPLLNNMIQSPAGITLYNTSHTKVGNAQVYPSIDNKTQSISIIAENLPTRMIRGYYTIRSNILEGNPFIGGKVNNTTMPIIGIVDKINGDGDFYFGQEGSLEFTITKPLRLASLTISIHDPDGSYARTSEQSTILFKIQKPKITTFNIARELMMEQQGKGKNPNL